MKKLILSVSVIVFAIITNSAKAAIPNSSFETWTNMGTYNNPDSWSTLNDMTSPLSVYTCVKGTAGPVGTSYIKLTSKNVVGMGVMPGVAVCGTIDNTTMQPTSGFPINERPQSLTGQWQYMASGADQGFISVILTHWDPIMMMRDTVSATIHPLVSMAMSWAAFNLPLMYLNGNDPDTAVIVLSASGTTPVSNSYLYVDGLAFTGSVAGLNVNSSIESISVFPNPTSDQLFIKLGKSVQSPITINIINVEGKVVKSFQNISASASNTVDVSDLPKNNYVISIQYQNEIFTKCFIKQ